MKGIGFALLCIVAAVQGRSLDVDGLAGIRAQAGENPWIVHLRVANAGGGGLLDTCVGSLIGPSWVLTAASCVDDARFIWLRYGTVDPIRPELVTETTGVVLNPNYNPATGENNVALVRINRVVQSTDNISPVALKAVDAESLSVGRVCGFGGQDGNPGEQLSCFYSALDVSEDGSSIIGDGGQLTEFDIGGPLVSDGVQVGVLAAIKDQEARARVTSFVNVADVITWIEQVTA